jgi:hypothetical protein
MTYILRASDRFWSGIRRARFTLNVAVHTETIRIVGGHIHDRSRRNNRRSIFEMQVVDNFLSLNLHFLLMPMKSLLDLTICEVTTK